MAIQSLADAVPENRQNASIAKKSADLNSHQQQTRGKDLWLCSGIPAFASARIPSPTQFEQSPVRLECGLGACDAIQHLLNSVGPLSHVGG